MLCTASHSIRARAQPWNQSARARPASFHSNGLQANCKTASPNHGQLTRATATRSRRAPLCARARPPAGWTAPGRPPPFSAPASARRRCHCCCRRCCCCRPELMSAPPLPRGRRRLRTAAAPAARPSGARARAPPPPPLAGRPPGSRGLLCRARLGAGEGGGCALGRGARWGGRGARCAARGAPAGTGGRQVAPACAVTARARPCSRRPPARPCRTRVVGRARRAAAVPGEEGERRGARRGRDRGRGTRRGGGRERCRRGRPRRRRAPGAPAPPAGSHCASCDADAQRGARPRPARQRSGRGSRHGRPYGRPYSRP
jgi:hypothetical protein